MNILFRADSSSTIGTGHIMRDLVLAEQFKDANIIFATQDLHGNVIHKIQEKKIAVEILNSNDIKEVIALIKKHSIDMIVLDSYDIDYLFEKELKEKTNILIFVLDDTYEKHDCDILLNHSISAQKKRYSSLVPEHCELRCGLKYTLIRDEFIREKNKFKIKKSKRKTIFIAMGGSDHSNIALKILKAIPNGYKVHMVTTHANKNLKKIKWFINTNKMLNLHINANNIAKLINNSDMAIISPSVISHEVLYMGVPFISILTGSDQKDIFQYYRDKKMITMKKFNRRKLFNYIIQLDSYLHRYKNIVKRVGKR